MVEFTSCHTTSASGQADLASSTLPSHWTKKTSSIRIGSKVLAVAAYNPLRVMYGTATSLPSSQLLGLFDHATLPAGVCVAGDSPPSIPIAVTPQANGVLVGPSGVLAPPNYYSVTTGPALAVSYANGRGDEVTTSVWCSQGGASFFSGIFVFSYTGSGWVTDYGPVPTRTYEEAGGTNDFGAGVTGVTGRGHSVVAAEEFGEPGDCGGCASGKRSTTWGWSSADPAHLVITSPAPASLKTTAAVTPTQLGGGSATGNQAGPQIAAGETVSATCIGEFSGDGSIWVELDTGAWIPSHDVAGILPNDCDGQTYQAASTCPSSDDAAFEASATQNPPPSSDISATVSNSACAGTWAIAAGQLNFGPGGGPSEWWFGAFTNSGGQWTTVSGGDGTCLLAPQRDQLPRRAGLPGLECSRSPQRRWSRSRVSSSIPPPGR